MPNSSGGQGPGKAALEAVAVRIFNNSRWGTAGLAGTDDRRLWDRASGDLRGYYVQCAVEYNTAFLDALLGEIPPSMIEAACEGWPWGGTPRRLKRHQEKALKQALESLRSSIGGTDG